MSIVACVKVYDGLALGADSMTHLYGQVQGAPQPQFWKAFSNARKLFKLRLKPGVGVLTYGAGNIGNRSVGSFLDEFGERVHNNPPDQSLADIANGLRDHIRAAYEAQYGQLPVQQQPVIGFYVAGYSSGEHIGSELEFMFPQGNVVNPRPAGFGASWRGIPLPFGRLYSGVDPRIFDILREHGVEPNVIANVQHAALRRLVSPVAFDGMPVQDAIGYCKFILETTIGVATYELGVASCGGPLHIAVITNQQGFEWVAEPKYNV